MTIDISMAVLLFISSLSNGLQALHHRSSGKARAVRVLAVHHGGGDLRWVWGRRPPTLIWSKHRMVYGMYMTYMTYI